MCVLCSIVSPDHAPTDSSAGACVLLVGAPLLPSKIHLSIQEWCVKRLVGCSLADNHYKIIMFEGFWQLYSASALWWLHHCRPTVIKQTPSYNNNLCLLALHRSLGCIGLAGLRCGSHFNVLFLFFLLLAEIST